MADKTSGSARRNKVGRRGAGDLWLTVEGYKTVRDPRTLRVAPLTIIAGVNSSGKSSFMQPFLMLKQTLDSAFDPGPLLLYGPNVKITDYAQLLSRGKAKNDIVRRFTVGMRRGNQSRITTYAEKGQGLSVESDILSAGEASLELTDNPSPSGRKKLREAAGSRAASYVKVFEDQPRFSSAADGGVKWDLEVYRNRCFLELRLVIEAGGISPLRIPISDEIADDDQWVNLLRGIIHVPGLRGNPERAYNRSAVGATYPGTFETYVASLVYEWSISNSARLGRLSSQLEDLGLTWKLAPRKLDDASIELTVGRMPHAQQGGAHDLVSVADVGFGVSQTLPVLVALLAANTGQIVYIEQPEIHLHPRAQLALGDILVEAANRGVMVVAETHSSLVIRGIQTAVAQNRLAAADLSLNWFGRDAFTGFQTITTAEIDEAGRFGDWPLDFDDVSRDADWAYLDAIQGREN
ncbi:AAA family ATPase [Agromyces binzhouensis]|uniref:AAA family ATPase n=1 Tax=Agromyces binzhouensis TaxID=1817495 RepID=UPI003643BCA5